MFVRTVLAQQEQGQAYSWRWSEDAGFLGSRPAAMRKFRLNMTRCKSMSPDGGYRDTETPHGVT